MSAFWPGYANGRAIKRFVPVGLRYGSVGKKESTFKACIRALIQFCLSLNYAEQIVTKEN